MQFLNCITVHLILLLSLWMVRGDQDCSCLDSVCLYEMMKTQLSTTYNADKLQLAFFNTIPFYGSAYINTTVNITTGNYSYPSVTWVHLWYPYSSTGVLRKMFPSIFRGAMDPWAALPVLSEVVSNDYFVYINLAINLSCESGDYPIPPPPTGNKSAHLDNSVHPRNGSVMFDGALKALWAITLQWAKAFGRVNGPAPYPDDGDRGIVYDALAFTHKEVLAFVLFCMLYVLFNLTIGITLMTAAPYMLKSFLKGIQARTYIKSLYWSSVLTGILYMIVYLIVRVILLSNREDVVSHAKGSIIFQLNDNFTIISCVVPLVLLPAHIITAACSSKAVPSEVIVPKQVQGVISRFCCRSCGHVLWTSSLWVVLAWLQLIAVSFIPVVVSILTDTFRSMALFGLLFSTIACVVVSGAVLIQICRTTQRHSKCSLFLSLMASFCGCLTVGVFTVYFLVLTEEGLDADSLAGYVLSLIPSLALGAIAYVADNFLMDSDKPSKDAKGKKVKMGKTAKGSDRTTIQSDLKEEGVDDDEGSDEAMISFGSDRHEDEM